MKVFLSWSGERSRIIAEALADWLPTVIQAVKPWVSSQDIDVGTRWGDEVAGELLERNFGVLCLTQENLDANWILFEAGALSKLLGKSRVCPYLIGLEMNDLNSPLSQFFGVQADREGTLKLVGTLNSWVAEPVASERLNRIFEAFWPNLEATLNALPPSTSPKPERSETDKLDEVLRLLRNQSRRSRNIAERTLANSTPSLDPESVIWDRMKTKSYHAVLSHLESYRREVKGVSLVSLILYPPIGFFAELHNGSSEVYAVQLGSDEGDPVTVSEGRLLDIYPRLSE